jgi:membrane protease YdiL (CAAX protease family)
MLTVQRREVLVFLFLIVPSMLLSLFVARSGALGFVATALATIFRDLSLVSLIAFFLWRNSESPQQIGWTSKRADRELALGIFLYLPFALLIAGTARLLLAAGLKIPTQLPKFLTPHGVPQVALAVLLVAMVAVAEEVIFRGYLILRFTQLTRNRAAAVLLSSAIFSLGHGYERTAGVVTVGIMGIALAVIYQWRKSLVAPIAMHFLQDFIGIVLVPLYMKR